MICFNVYINVLLFVLSEIMAYKILQDILLCKFFIIYTV